MKNFAKKTGLKKKKLIFNQDNARLHTSTAAIRKFNELR